MNRLLTAALAGAALFFTAFMKPAKPPIIKVDELVKRYMNKSDTTYVINFWATWCAPCVKELPYFETINNNYINKKVKVLLVSLDFREDYEKKLIPFLEKRGIGCEVVLLDETNGSYFIPKINPDWGGTLPSTMIINSVKGVNKLYERPVEYEELEEAVKKCE